MKEEIKPIKRSKELAPLSREHHEGLLFGWKIKQGYRYSTTKDRIARYCKWFWETHLQHHFLQEETEFARIISPEDPLYIQMKEEHILIKKGFEELNADSPAHEFIHVADLLTAHIRFEERNLFNYIEQQATPEQLLMLMNHATDKRLETWEDEFWMKGK